MRIDFKKTRKEKEKCMKVRKRKTKNKAKEATAAKISIRSEYDEKTVKKWKIKQKVECQCSTLGKKEMKEKKIVAYIHHKKLL